jgi:hypothetical protein
VTGFVNWKIERIGQMKRVWLQSAPETVNSEERRKQSACATFGACHDGISIRTVFTQRPTFSGPRNGARPCRCDTR